MANNLDVKDTFGATKTLKTTDNGGVHTPHHNVDLMPADPFGANSDAAVATDDVGSINAHLRGLVKIQAERTPAALGQTTKSASLPVTLASDQNALPITSAAPLTVAGTVGLSASENHLGEVGGRIKTITIAPSVSTTPAYSAGDSIGTLLTFSNAVRVAAGSGVIQSVIVADKAKQDAAMDLYLFEASPGGTTATDNAALTIAAADLLTCIGVVSIATGDYKDAATNSVATVRNVGLGFALPSGTTLYGLLISRGTPTYASSSDVQVRLAIQQN